MKALKRSTTLSASEPNTDLLMERLRPFLSQFPFTKKHCEGKLSAFAIQLREPDYWMVFAGFEPGPSRFQILFDGTWKDAVNYFSEKASSLPRPDFIPFPIHEGESNFDTLCQDALRDALVGLPKALLSGDSSLSIFPAGVFVLKHGGVLLETTNFYFEAWFAATRQQKVAKPPFTPGRERKAFYCRFPIPLASTKSRLAYKARLYRDLAQEKELFRSYPAVRTTLFNDKVTILLFPNGLVVADERHREIAIDALGALLAYSFFRGVGCAPASIQDLGWMIIKDTGDIDRTSGDLPPSRLKGWNAAVISASKLNGIFRGFASGVESELLSDLKLLHQAVFHFWAGENLQSFTLAFTVIERRINQLWKLRMGSKGYSGTRLDELCNSDRYTMSVIIDMLDVSKELSSEQAMRIHSLRKSRNKAMHEGRSPTSEIALDCLRLAIEFTGEHWKDLQFDPANLQRTADDPT